MTDEDRIRELEKRVEKLENRNRNIGRILLVSALASGGGVCIFFSILPLIFFPDKLKSLAILAVGVASLVSGLYMRNKWGIKDIVDQ